MKAIETYKLSKSFNDIQAVNAIDLEVEEGEVFGLLGLNGAGKTTTIKILSGLLKPTSGEAIILGYDLNQNLEKIKEIINVAHQESAVANNLTVKENLMFIGEIYGMERSILIKRLNEIVQQIGLSDFLNRKVGKLSGGMKRRVSIGMALITNPKILFLDEPTVGLDIISRRELWQVIKELRKKTTVILTTHYLEEAEALCDNIAIMVAGNVAAIGTAEKLIEQSNSKNFEDAFIKIATKGEL